MSTADAVKREIDRRAEQGWTGQLTVDFKQGDVRIGKEKIRRGEKRISVK